MIYKTDEEIELIRESCLLVSKTLAEVAKVLVPGTSGIKIDRIAEEYIRDNGAVPGFKGYGGFPSTLCISVNEQVVHGIPSDREFTGRDIVSIDCGVYMNGFYGDAAYTFIFKEVDQRVKDLCKVTLESLYIGIENAIVGKRLGDIGSAIQFHTENRHRYGVVRELVGHGLGRDLHEPPEVSNFGKRGSGPLLRDGLVIAIEPMINLGGKSVKKLKDDWTIVTRDALPSAHYEHTVAVRKNKADILSNHSFLEENIKNNDFLESISINC
jgi:methionyl aminopeptidase